MVVPFIKVFGSWSLAGCAYFLGIMEWPIINTGTATINGAYSCTFSATHAN